ncbi:hypothetical protein Syun_003794 [Stephania yunnanensis]|uniref:Pectin acetylesterase n=1 Tax=Stephania yunnanensis TaxID=152371 RepID=A0AAP0Q055_9MAGN
MTTLSAMARLLAIKSEHHISERGYNEIIKFMKDCLPNDNSLVEDFYATKRLMYFNSLQSKCFARCFLSDINMVISAPTGSGKTVLFELCILRLLSRFLSQDGKFNHVKGTLKDFHLLNDQRGASLEVIVNNLKMLARNPEMNYCALARVRFIVVPATIPYVEDLDTGLKSSIEKKLRGESMTLSVGDWFFDRVGVSAIDCTYPCDNTCHNLVFK